MIAFIVCKDEAVPRKLMKWCKGVFWLCFFSISKLDGCYRVQE